MAYCQIAQIYRPRIDLSWGHFGCNLGHEVILVQTIRLKAVKKGQQILVHFVSKMDSTLFVPGKLTFSEYLRCSNFLLYGYFGL